MHSVVYDSKTALAKIFEYVVDAIATRKSDRKMGAGRVFWYPGEAEKHVDSDGY
jgi:hypothetical protein